MYLLDKDSLTVLDRNSEGADRLRARLATLRREDVATTIINYEEQMRGWLNYIAQAKKQEAQVEAYRRLRRMVEDYCLIKVLPYDDAAAAIFATVRKTDRRTGTPDLKIASIALAHDATLLTRNLSDFSRVPNLRAEDWTT